jgi:ribosomal protein S18 acetylase RimI-like enzyme
MTEHIGQGLDLISLPRRKELGEYDWFDIELNGLQVGKSRCRVDGDSLTVFSIMIYPEYGHRGYARAVIDFFKTRFAVLHADRVRFNAREFWRKLDFTEESEDQYIWRSKG